MLIEFDADADDQHAALHASLDRGLIRAVEQRLDWLEEDPGRGRCRQHPFTQQNMWGITVPTASGDDWIILWSVREAELSTDDEAVVIWYVGPWPRNR